MFPLVSKYFRSISLVLGTAFSIVAWPSVAQDEILDERWILVSSENFQVYSQRSERQTNRFLRDLEYWRQISAFTIAGVDNFPSANVPNIVYLFDDVESLHSIASSNDPSFFAATPRANFLAFVDGDSNSLSVGMHYYSHFLVRNFSDLRLPRWYEEGLAGYIARMQVDGDDVEFERFTQEGNDILASVSETLSMDRLLYSDAALASPRVVQIANVKSSTLLHYFLHAYEEEGFNDRRGQLESYLGYLLEGRNPRYAFDRSFDITTTQLDAELQDYLINSRRPPGRIEVGNLVQASIVEGVSIEGAELASRLAELALNSGNFEVAGRLFERAVEYDANYARGLSGMGDALRMQEVEGRDQQIARYFVQAVEAAPQDATILLDYGEYWEEELEDCENIWPPAERSRINADVLSHFERAIQINPQSPEANLAMGEYYLLEGNDWAEGKVYQDRAFELLPADTFIIEQAARYAIAGDQYEEAERLITELAQPIHFFGEPIWVTELRERLLRKRRGEPFNACD